MKASTEGVDGRCAGWMTASRRPPMMPKAPGSVNALGASVGAPAPGRGSPAIQSRPRDGRRPATSPSGSSAGTSIRQRSIAYGQRLWNAQPDGGFSGDGSSPLQRDALAPPLRRRARGVLASSARVYGCAGRAKTVALGPCSTILPRYITSDRVGDVAHDLQVVRNEQVGDAHFLLQIHQQVQHLRLDRHVERRHRLVGDDQPRIAASARARPRCAAAGRRRTCADSADSARAAGRPCAIIARAASRRAAGVEAGVDRQRLLEQRADLLARIERRVRILEHHLHQRPQPLQRRRVGVRRRRRRRAAARRRSAARSSSPAAPASTCRSPIRRRPRASCRRATRERHAVERAHEPPSR